MSAVTQNMVSGQLKSAAETPQDYKNNTQQISYKLSETMIGTRNLSMDESKRSAIMYASVSTEQQHGEEEVERAASVNVQGEDIAQMLKHHNTLQMEETAKREGKVAIQEMTVRSNENNEIIDNSKEIGTSMYRDQPPQIISIRSRSRSIRRTYSAIITTR